MRKVYGVEIGLFSVIPGALRVMLSGCLYFQDFMWYLINKSRIFGFLPSVIKLLVIAFLLGHHNGLPFKVANSMDYCCMGHVCVQEKGLRGSLFWDQKYVQEK
jgi:hypothetical protein